jgi:effector-binding domain-containing protein
MEIITDELTLIVSGFGGVAANKNYAGTAFALMDKMWPVIKARGVKHKGMNIWVYEANEKVFAGVELVSPSVEDTGLEQKTISLKKYAYHKHIGPYSLVTQAGDYMQNEIRKMGLKSTLPHIEIYGHWTNDDSKLETELLMAIE